MNRIIDTNKKNKLIDLIEKYNYKYIDLKFNLDEYNLLPKININDFQFNKLNKQEKINLLYKHNLYLININGCRNFVINYGKKHNYDYILPFDGNIYINFNEYLKMINNNYEYQYLIFPIIRLDDYNLTNYEIKKLDNIQIKLSEPQIVFNKKTDHLFNELIPYGLSDKAEFLRALNVPGNWQNWNDNLEYTNIIDRNFKNINYKIVGNVIRLNTYHSKNNFGIYNHENRWNNIYKLINLLKIKNVESSPKKNNSFPLIGICVSYKYIDTLKYVLPTNYLHFEKIYLVTQNDDIETIEFCKNFDNIEIIYCHLQDNKRFYKDFGIITAQKKAYKYYPNYWYLIFDSDILLPNNLINILQKSHLNENCIYGADRYIILNSSQLLEKQNYIYNNKQWENNILWTCNSSNYKYCRITGYFQLYKKHYYYDNNIHKNGYHHDIEFGKYFNLFCQLNNIICFHLGNISKNWYGKIDYFIDDIDISLNDIYYESLCDYKLIYYDKNKNLYNF